MSEGRKSVPEIRFEWDQAKAQTNLTKHGISFEEATDVFKDPLNKSAVDPASPVGEERWITTGMSARLRLLIVVHADTELSDDVLVVRIISARRATRNERKQYEQ